MERFTSRITPPATQLPQRRHKFVFENIIDRQGYFIMAWDTWNEYNHLHAGGFNEALNMVGLTAQPVAIGYKITYI